MYSVSSGFQTAIKETQRTIKAYVIINGVTYTSEKISLLKYSHGVNSETFEVGLVPSAYCEITLVDVFNNFDGLPVQPFIGVEVSGVFQYVPLGKFTVEETKKSKNTVTIKCQDDMVKLETEYVSTLTYPTSLSNVLNEVLTGFQSSITLPSYMSVNVGKVEKKTKRQVLGYIATLFGGFAYVDREGVFRFKLNPVYPDVNSDLYLDGSHYFELDKEDIQYRIQTLKLNNGTSTWEKGFEVAYAGTFRANEEKLPQTQTFTLYAQSPYATESMVPQILNRVGGLPIRTYSMEWLGNPAVELGDSLTVTEFINEGTTETIYLSVGETHLTYDGSLRGDLSNVGEGKAKNAFQSMGEIASAINTVQNNVSTVQASADQAQTTANGKNTVFYNPSTSVPTATKVNDVWFVSNLSNQIRRWNGTAWVESKLGTNALGEIDASQVTVSNLDAGAITTGVLSANRINAGSISFNKLDSSTQGTITTANTNASSAQTIAQQIVAGTYTGGTFIDGKTIYSATIVGGTISSNSTINVATNATIGNNLYLGDINSNAVGGKTIMWNGTARIRNVSDGLGGFTALSISASSVWITNGDVYINNLKCDNTTASFSNSTVNFTNATVTGLNVTAKFG